MDRELHQLMLRQYNTISRAQLRLCAMTDRQIGRMVTNGALERVFAGVFRDPSTPISIEQRAFAAWLAGGETSWVSHRMALAMWKMRNYRCDLAEVTSLRSIVQPRLIAHRCRTEPETRKLRGVPVTTPAQTMLDCGTVLSRPIHTRFLETWLSTGTVKLADLDRLIIGNPRHPGTRQLVAAFGSRTIRSAEADSPAESELGSMIVRQGFPVPVLHHLVTVSTGADFELDWSYPELMIAFELDGYGIHLRSLDAFENDRIRRNELTLDGWQILSFTTRMLRNKPQTVISQVRRAIEKVTDLNNAP